MCSKGSVVVVVRSGILRHTLPVAILERPATINQDLRCLDCGDANVNEWLAIALRAFSREILERNREGTTVQSVKSETLREFALPLPPLAEQKRIVAKLEELLRRLGAARERLARLPALLKRFRQSVLAAACSGQLTDEWRNATSEYESPSLLLGRMLTQRRAAWQEFPANRGRSYREPQTPAVSKPDHLPDEWAWITIDQAAWHITKGSSPAWQGFDYIDDGVPFVRSQNIRWGKVDLTDLAHLGQEFNDKHPGSVIRAGDVLLNLVGASVGRAALATKTIHGANLNQAVAIIRLATNGLNNKFLMYYLLSPWGQSYITDTKADVARANFNLDDVRPTYVPLPSQEEQLEIVRRVDALFALADKIEARVKAATARVEKITQAILAKAFRGELVPTEAELARQEGRDYEPATVLLERIRAERSDDDGAPKRATRRPASPDRQPKWRPPVNPGPA
jgi:type I restriction enzyme S subunit